MAINERPGVYSSYYVVEGGMAQAGTAKTVAVAAKAYAVSTTQPQYITSRLQAAALYGAHSSMTQMINTLFLNGAGSIAAVSVGGPDAAASDYAAAFARLMAMTDISCVVCDSDDEAVHAALKYALDNAPESARYRICIVCAQGQADALCIRARNLNDERIILMDAPFTAAAAFAGYLACHTDPTVSLSGAVLKGAGMQDRMYSDNEINALVRGGVTPVECVQGEARVVRAVTSRTLTDGEPDSSRREVTTVRIINTVVPAVRSALRARFSGGRNDVRTRSAIRTQVSIELEKLRKSGIIDGYGDVYAGADADDPTVCAVSFSFRAVYALEFIELTACVTV